MSQTILIILANPPYDGTDAAWNALRLVGQLHKDGVTVRLFLMNDAVDLARESIKPPDGYFDLVRIVKELIAAGVAVRVRYVPGALRNCKRRIILPRCE